MPLLQKKKKKATGEAARAEPQQRKKKKKVVKMFKREEEIEEDEEVQEEERIRRRRKKFQKKSELMIEEEEEEVEADDEEEDEEEIRRKPMCWVGSQVDTSVDATLPNSSTSSASSGSSRYAVLQVVSDVVGDKIEKHVNVLHVGDWYSFTAPSTARAVVSLDDVNAEFERRQRQKMESNKKYSKLLSSYRRGGDREGDESKEEEDEAPVLFGKSATGRSSMLAHLTDGGIDVDANENNNWKDVDMTTAVSDDEDDTGNIQAQDNDQMERAADVEDAYSITSALQHSDADTDDEDDEDEDEAAAKKDKIEQAQAKLEHLEGGAGQLQSALEFKEKVLSTIKEKDGANKRKLERAGDGYDDTKGKKGVTIDSNGNKLKKAKHVTLSDDTRSHSPVRPSTSSSTVLNEDNVLQYIKRQGGRVQSRVLMKEFKKSMKELGSSAKDIFRNIVIKLTKKEEDSVLGTMLVLKQKYQ